MKNRLKKLCLFLFALMLITTNVFANFAIIETKKVEVTIKGINEEIEKIELYTYGRKVSFEEVFGGTFDMSIVDDTYLNSAYIRDNVSPFTKEDYVENKNYDDNKYMVNISYSYDYRFTSKTEDSYIEYGFDQKFNNMNELKNGVKNHNRGSSGSYNTNLNLENYDDELEKYIDNAKLSCERTISYSINKYEFYKELSTSLIKDKTMKFDLDDFKSREELITKDGTESEIFMIRFYPKNNNKKDYIIGDNIIRQDSHIKERPSIKSVNIEYNNQGGEEPVPPTEVPPTEVPPTEVERTFMSVLKDNVSNIIIALVVTLVIELIVAFTMKLKSYGVITITNIITQIILHIATIIMIVNYETVPMYFYYIAEMLIVIIEFVVYALFIKDVSKSKLGLYSLSANVCSFGISLLIHYL